MHKFTLIASAYSVLDVSEKIASIIASLSIVIAVADYLLQRLVLRLEHERARQEKAVAIVADYAKSLTARSSAARKLARHFNSHQIDCLDSGQEFEINQEFKELLIAALPDDLDAKKIEAANGPIRLTRPQSFLLRWEIISRLNSCEAVAQSWLLDVAHKVTIENELRFLLDDESNKNILTTFGKLANQKFSCITCPHGQIGKGSQTETARSAACRTIACLDVEVTGSVVRVQAISGLPAAPPRSDPGEQRRSGVREARPPIQVQEAPWREAGPSNMGNASRREISDASCVSKRALTSKKLLTLNNVPESHRRKRVRELAGSGLLSCDACDSVRQVSFDDLVS
jgi:hypothetical protein